MDMCLCNGCCRGKAISIICFVCVCVCSLSYLACNAHAPAPLYNTFSYYLIKGMIFEKKKKSYRS